MEDTLTIAPPSPTCSIFFTACLQQRNTPPALTRITRSHSERLISCTCAKEATPALHTRRSMCSIPSMSSFTAAFIRDVRPQEAHRRKRFPRPSRVLPFMGIRRRHQITFALQKRGRVAKPMPRVPPVTSAYFCFFMIFTLGGFPLFGFAEDLQNILSDVLSRTAVRIDDIVRDVLVDGRAPRHQLAELFRRLARILQKRPRLVRTDAREQRLKARPKEENFAVPFEHLVVFGL